MTNRLHQKMRKLYTVISKSKVEVRAIHEDIFHCINIQSRWVKFERSSKDFVTVVDNNEDSIALLMQNNRVYLFLH